MEERALDDRAKRIVDTAITLAERDGYSAVRLRDVAATAQVALGTVYKRFGSKEEILVAALEQEIDKLVTRVGKKAPPGDTADERIRFLFGALTRALLRRPNLARALVRSIASGDPNVTEQVASFHAVITALIIAAMRGVPAADYTEWIEDANEREHNVASVLQQVWFAALVGWAGGLHDMSNLLEQVDLTADLIFGEAA